MDSVGSMSEETYGKILGIIVVVMLLLMAGGQLYSWGHGGC